MSEERDGMEEAKDQSITDDLAALDEINLEREQNGQDRLTWAQYDKRIHQRTGNQKKT